MVLFAFKNRKIASRWLIACDLCGSLRHMTKFFDYFGHVHDFIFLCFINFEISAAIATVHCTNDCLRPPNIPPAIALDRDVVMWVAERPSSPPPLLIERFRKDDLLWKFRGHLHRWTSKHFNLVIDTDMAIRQ